jgi:hypothetical protein
MSSEVPREVTEKRAALAAALKALFDSWPTRDTSALAWRTHVVLIAEEGYLGAPYRTGMPAKQVAHLTGVPYNEIAAVVMLVGIEGVEE